MAAALLLGGCGKKDAADATASVVTEAVHPAVSFLLAEVPEGATNLNAALRAAVSGDTIIATGRVGGSKSPLSDDFAGFVLADEVIEFCDEMGDSHCATPWDACCEDPDKIAASRAFVQFVDGEGMPLQVSLREVIGLKENDSVIVRGTLSPDSTPGNRIIIAEGIALAGQG